ALVERESAAVAETLDAAPGADSNADADSGIADRRRLQEMAREADALAGKGDLKLEKGIELVRSLLDDGFNPIVFCRFIPTAGYVADQLRAQLPESVTVAAVTGELA